MRRSYEFSRRCVSCFNINSYFLSIFLASSSSSSFINKWYCMIEKQVVTPDKVFFNLIVNNNTIIFETFSRDNHKVRSIRGEEPSSKGIYWICMSWSIWIREDLDPIAWMGIIIDQASPYGQRLALRDQCSKVYLFSAPMHHELSPIHISRNYHCISIVSAI